jgi:hypothetical protein
MKATYIKSEKIIILGDFERAFLNVPIMEDFNNHPPIKRFFKNTMLRSRGITQINIKP